MTKVLPDSFDYKLIKDAYNDGLTQGMRRPNKFSQSINTPKFSKTAIITEVVPGDEDSDDKGKHYTEYKAEEAVVVYDEDSCTHQWKAVSEITDDVKGSKGAVWNRDSVYEPFSNQWDNLVPLQNAKYYVGDIVTVSLMDRGYQPTSAKSVPLADYAQRWYITGGLPKDGSETWQYIISDDKKSLEIDNGSGAIRLQTVIDFSALCTDCIETDRLQIFQYGQNVEFSAADTGARPSITANDTSGTIYFYLSYSSRGFEATFAEAGFTNSTDPFTTPVPGLGGGAGDFNSIDFYQGYQEWRGASQLVSPITSVAYDRGDYDAWILIPLANYLAHEDCSNPGEYLIYDVSPQLKTVEDLRVDYGDQLSPEEGCGILIDGNEFSIDPDIAGANLTFDTATCKLNATGGGGKVYKVEVTNTCTALSVTTNTGTATDTYTLGFDATGLAGNGLVNNFNCELSIGAGCGITVNADDIQLDTAALAGDGLAVSTGTGCEIEVDVGCGLSLSGGKIVIDNSTLAGDGLIPSGSCGLQVDVQDSIIINTDTLQLDGDSANPPASSFYSVLPAGPAGARGWNNIGAFVQYSIDYDGTNNKLQLDGDDNAPGNRYFYGTDGTGTKGFNELEQIDIVTDVRYDTGTDAIQIKTRSAYVYAPSAESAWTEITGWTTTTGCS